MGKLIEEHVDKRLKKNPGKQDAVFLLYKDNRPVGSAFAVDKHRVLTARHNLFQLDAVSDNASEIYVKIDDAVIKLQVEATLEPTLEIPTLSDVDDWIILRSATAFARAFILIVPKEGNMLQNDRPYITIYHYPIDYHDVNDVARTAIFSSQNRVSQVSDGKLYCNDLCNVSGGSCGGPYVDNSSGGAYGMHIEGLNSYSGGNRLFKSISDAVCLMPVALHFGPDSLLVAKLKELKVL